MVISNVRNLALSPDPNGRLAHRASANLPQFVTFKTFLCPKTNSEAISFLSEHLYKPVRCKIFRFCTVLDAKIYNYFSLTRVLSPHWHFAEREKGLRAACSTNIRSHTGNARFQRPVNVIPEL